MRKCSNPNCTLSNPQERTQFYKDKQTETGLSSYCKTCCKQKSTRYASNNKERVAAFQAKYQKENKEKIAKYLAEYGPKYYEKNRQKICEYQATYRLENKEIFNTRIANWATQNPGKRNAITAKYRASKKKRTPSWLNNLQLKEIQSFYIEAAKITEETGTPYHVDHIVPLQGDQVSGLHVPWNLQILVGPGPEGNLSKSNRF